MVPLSNGSVTGAVSAPDAAAHDLADACAAWQGGRGGGSSPIRAAARNLTGVKHYFEAPFIADYERKAAADPVTTRRAEVLLDALMANDALTPAEWAESLGVGPGWVGRGIVSGEQDDQILATLRTGVITMPLWGTSLDSKVADGFGSRFTFELRGPIPAVPAWVHSGIKAEEAELICGGHYRVEDMVDTGPAETKVLLSFVDFPQMVAW